MEKKINRRCKRAQIRGASKFEKCENTGWQTEKRRNGKDDAKGDRSCSEMKLL